MFKKISVLMLLGLLVLSGVAFGAEKELKVGIWRGYIAPTVLEEFQNEFGVKATTVWYDTYGQMFDLVDNGEVDLVITGDLGIPSLIKQDKLMELDKSKIENLNNVDPLFKGLSFDKNNTYSTPYHYIYVGLIYHKDRVKKSEATLQNYFEAPEKFEGRLSTHPHKRYMIGMALKYMGVSMNNLDEDNLELAKELITILKDNLTDEGKDMTRSVISPHQELLDGKADMAINYCAESTRRFFDTNKIGYVLPSEGAIVTMDFFSIPKNSGQKDLAHKFINFMYKPEIAAMEVNYMGNPYPVTGVKELIKPEFAENPAIYPPANVVKRLEFAKYLSEDKLEIYDEIWEEVFGE